MGFGARNAAILACASGLVLPRPAAAQTAPPDAQGKIVSMRGQVQHVAAKRDDWSAARVFQSLFVAERVRTLVASRAAILFIDESQVKLNAGAVLTVQQIRSAGAPSTTLRLESGEGWFRTKNPQSGLKIETPAAAAAIRGTEINLSVAADNQTTLTVVEGSVEFSNALGSIQVNAGEEGTARPRQAPTKRTVLNPEDAVQWTLYYPTDVADAERQAAPAGSAAAVADAHAQRASELLAWGRVADARTEIDAALAAAPGAVRPLVLLSTIELRRNHPEEALQAAERALAVRADSPGALIAASEAEQARFELDAARRDLDRALQADPKNVHALVNRARLLFGTGHTREARADMTAAVAIAPDESTVRSLRGFIELADGSTDAAVQDFQSAVGAETEIAEPHLGLGLAYFKTGRTNDGLLEMLTATLLEPKVSLYQSYLGKAYYQEGRFSEGLAALETAKRLDPHDPTPWLYSSLFLRDQNRQADALESLRHAIALNDYRAVYRSRLLLDRDLATKNVSLAEIYRQLGFAAWGAYEAENSLETDFTNASAHLFMADSYGQLPDRLQATSSELLQYFLYAPVNRNSFNNFAEYTALLDQPRNQLEAEAQTGSRTLEYLSATSRSGNDRFAHVAFVQDKRTDAYRPGLREDKFDGFFQGKVALGARADLFLTARGTHAESGDSLDTAEIVGVNTNAIVVRRFRNAVDPYLVNHFKDVEGTVGFRQQWSVGSSLTTTLRYDNLEQRVDDPHGGVTCNGYNVGLLGFATNTETVNPYESVDWQIQQTTRLGRSHQLIVGQQVYSLHKSLRCSGTVFDPNTDDVLFSTSRSQSGNDPAQATYVRDEIQITPAVHATVGVSYQHAKYVDFDGNHDFDLSQWNPLLGASVRVAAGTFVRAAAFRNLNTNFLGARISPPTISGFVVERNELPTAHRREYDLSVEHSASRAFGGARYFNRDTEVPFVVENGNFIPDGNATSHGIEGYVNWVVAPRLSVLVDNQFVHMHATMLDRNDNVLTGGGTFIDRHGISVTLTGSYITQRFSNTTISGLTPSDFGLANLEVWYEFARKRGKFDLTMSNAFNTRFTSVIEGLATTALEPQRRAVASIRWRLF